MYYKKYMIKSGIENEVLPNLLLICKLHCYWTVSTERGLIHLGTVLKAKSFGITVLIMTLTAGLS
jgi:hypothetical protein